MENKYNNLRNEPILGSKYNIKGTSNPELRAMILCPEEFYEPPSEDEWRKIEPNRRKRDKIKDYYQQMIEQSIVSDALLLHEQNLESMSCCDESGKPIIDKKKMEKIKDFILGDKENLSDEELLNKTEIEFSLPIGSLQKIIKVVESQGDRLDQIKKSINKRRHQFLENAQKCVEQEDKEFIDPLTGGLSQTGLEDFYYTIIKKKEEEKKENDCILLIAFDIDSFKIINDDKGHAEGDRILKEIIDRLKKGVDDLRGLRISDGVGRRSGDEFILILETSDKKEDIDSVIKRIQDIICSIKNPLGGNLSVSGGVLKIELADIPNLSYKKASALADQAANWVKIHKPGSLQMYSEQMDFDNIEKMSEEEQRKFVSQKVKRAKRRDLDKMHLALRLAEGNNDQERMEKIKKEIDLFNKIIEEEVDAQVRMLEMGII